MKRIPVGATVAHAYRFLFSDFVTLLRAIWLPLLAQLAVITLLTQRLVLFLSAMQAHDPSATSLFAPLLLFFPLAAIFFFAQYTAAIETALGRPPQSWLAFHFGKPMWRLTGGFLSALLAIFATALAALLGVWLLSLGLDVILKAAPGTRPAIAIFAGLLVAAYSCSLFFFSLRFLFLLAPVNISEQRLGVRRAWQLSAGNFWRILLVTLAIILPLSIINYVYIFAVAGFPPRALAASKEAADAAKMAWQITELNAMAAHWYFTLPLTGLMMLFQLGAGSAAQVFAYRALTAEDPSVPVASD